MVRISDIRRTFADASPTPAIGEGDAAVAVLLRDGRGGDLELCLIRRAKRLGDRWSGQLAFPGGRPQSSDRHLRDTAERETLEEVGLDLSGAEAIGTLPSVPIHRGPGDIEGGLYPYLYYLGGSEVALELEPSEVDDAFFTPLNVLWQPERRTAIHIAGRAFPGVSIGRDTLWGLTLRVCERWLAEIGVDLGLSWPNLGP